MSRRCDLSIALEQPRSTLAVGDTLTGFVGVEVNQAATCRDLTLTLRWRTHGRGNRTSGDVKVLHLFEGEWSEGETHLHPFELRLPEDGPMSYSGHLVNIVWELEARADIPWALDPKATQELVLVQASPPHPLTRGSAWRQDAPALSSMVQSIVLGVMGLLVTGMGCMGSAVTALGTGGLEGLLFALIPLAFALIGVILLWFAVKNPLARWRLGDVQLSAPDTARPGEPVEVELRFTPRQALHLNGIALRLRGQEVAVAGSGTNKRTYRHQLHLEEQSLLGEQQVGRGQEVMARGNLVLPTDAPRSFMANSNEVRWEVEVDLDIARWPDWKRSLRLAVGG